MRHMLPGGFVEPSAKTRTKLIRRQLDPVTTLTSLIHDDTRGTEHGEHAGDSEELGPAHDHVRYGTDDRLDDTAGCTRRSSNR